MIEFIRGKVDDLTPTTVVLETNGIGFLMNISLNTYTELQMKEEAKLYIFEAIREDAYQLYGFSSKKERTLFEYLLSVSGVGGNTARMILSAFSPQEITRIIATEDSQTLKSVKGIGLKTAQRIIVDLKDKITKIEGDATSIQKAKNVYDDTAEEAVSALTMLGFAPSATQKVVSHLLQESSETLTVEQIIKKALKAL